MKTAESLVPLPIDGVRRIGIDAPEGIADVGRTVQGPSHARPNRRYVPLALRIERASPTSSVFEEPSVIAAIDVQLFR